MKYLILFFFSILSFGQQTTKVDFKRAFVAITIDSNEKRVAGKMTYEFVVNQPIDTIRIDAINMGFSDVSNK